MMLILVVQLGFDLLVVFQIPTKLLLEGRLNAVLLEWLSGELFVGLKLEEEVFGVERQLWVHLMENWILVYANT